MSIEAMKQALGALDGVADWVNTRTREHPWDQWQRVEPAMTALRAAIEQAEKHEPFGYFQYAPHFDAWVQNRDSSEGVAFYTAPRQWVGLTDEEIFKVENAVPDEVIGDSNWCIYFAKAIAARLKEKNT